MKLKKEKKSQSNIELIIKLIVKVKKDDIFALASQLSYYMILSFFPLVIFLTSLLASIDIDYTDLTMTLKNMMPLSVYKLTKSIVDEVITTQSVSLVGGSIFVAIWVASSGFRAVIKGVNKAYNIKETRSYIKRTIIAYISTIIFAFTIIATLIVLVFGKVIGDYILKLFPLTNVFVFIWNALRYLIIIIFLIIIFASIYKFTPCKRLKWKDVIPGAMLSAIGWIISSLAFSFYINNINNYSRFYGSVAAVFILMLWIFITSIFIIFGVEVNSVLTTTQIEK